jgi:hypothetical protein
MPLTHFDIRNTKPADKPFKISDGGGLFLLVQPHGAMLWRLKYRFLGKERTLSFGAYPVVSPADARGQGSHLSHPLIFRRTRMFE